MSHKMLRPFLVKVSVLGYFPLYMYILYIYITNSHFRVDNRRLSHMSTIILI